MRDHVLCNKIVEPNDQMKVPHEMQCSLPVVRRNKELPSADIFQL